MATAVLEEKQGIWHWLDENFEKIFLVAGLIAIICFITLQTFYRYIVSNLLETAGAMVWTEEISRYIFIWITYFAVCVAIKKRSSIRIDIIYEKLPKRWQEISWIVVDGCFLLLTLVIAITGWGQIERLMQYPQYTTALRIPFLVPYLILPIGFGLMSLRLIQNLWKQIKVCGTTDTIIGLVALLALGIPMYPVMISLYVTGDVFIYDYIAPLPALFGYFIALCVLGVPIAIGLGLSTLATIICADTLPLEYLSQVAFTSLDNFPIMAIPFFIAAGEYMGEGGLSSRLLKLADSMLGGMYGGMAMTTVVTCMFFGAISGSGPATVAAIGSLTIPAMLERGYNKAFSCAIVAAAGALGVMIPPSNPFVVYGIAAQVSIGDLFISGIIPGILCGLVLMAYSYFHSKKMGWKGDAEERSGKKLALAAWDAKWALMVPVIVLGGIYGGFMTPTEAAAVAAFYGIIVGVFIYREIDLKKLFKCSVSAAETSATIILLMAMATIFGNIMTIEDVPGTIARAILDFTNSKFFILLIINILLLIVGVFMEALAAIVILTPILLPVVTGVGVSPLHFGVIMVVNLAIGFLTPPVGVNLFVASGVSGENIIRIAKAALPMIGLMILVLLVITYFPQVPLCLIGN